MLMNKKSNLEDPITAIFIIFGVVITLFVIYQVNTNFADNIKGNNATNISEITGNLDTYNSRFLSGWDYGVLFLALGFIIFSYIASRKLPVDDKIMIIAFFLFVFFLIIAMLVSNIHGRMLENATYNTFVEGTVFIKLLMPNLLWYVMIYIFIVCVGLFTKGEG